MATDPGFSTLFIGPNHSASLSITEAFLDALGKERSYDVAAFSRYKANELPTPAEHLQQECERIMALPQFPVFINSHHPLPLHVLMKGRDIRYITILRNPTRRVISYYHWAHLHKDLDYHWVAPAIRAGATLEQYVDYVGATGHFPGGLSPCEYFTRNWVALGLVPDELKTHLVGTARYVLETYFTVVGIAEMFDESLYVYSRAMGLAEPPRWKHRGKSGAGSLNTIPEGVRAKIRKLVEPEMAVYMHFAQQFFQRHRKEIEEFKALGISLRAEGDTDTITPFRK